MSLMRLYLTHCSAKKDSQLKETGETVTPDRLYTDFKICQFMERCKQKNVQWAILSDRYGIYQSDDCRAWYEKHPDTVTSQEKDIIIQDFDSKLDCYDEIYFFVRTESFHPFYEKVLKETALADRVRFFQDLSCIE